MIDVLELRAAGDRYALPLARVVEVAPRVLVRPLPQVSAPIAGCLNYRGQIIAAVDLGLRLGAPPRQPALGDHFVIARTHRRLIALVVERALEVARVDSSAVVAPPASAEAIGGIARLAGGLILIVDLDALLSLEAERQLAAALAEAPRT